MENIEATYVLDTEDRLKAWSKQRLRQDTFLVNPVLRQFLPHGQQASVYEIRLINGSVLYAVTDEGAYNKVEGKTNTILILDEAQKQDLEYLSIAAYSLRTTKGPLIMMGVGGESGSQWQRKWYESTQYTWEYNDKSEYVDSTTGRRYPHQGWRHNLRFNEDGNIINTNEELEIILAGHWVAKGDEDAPIHGYHMPQTIFATIPLTIHDAIHLYKTRPDDSIEHQEKHLPKSIYTSHTLGYFYAAKRRPITAELVASCITTNTLLTGQQVKALKALHKNNLQVYQGIDWGSGPSASSTVGSIVLHWVKTNRFQLVDIDIDPCTSEQDEAPHFIEKFLEYGVDLCVADMGYGANKVEFMQKGGYHSTTGKMYPPLGNGKVKGAWSSGNLTRDELDYDKQSDMEGVKKKDHLSVDKTQIIQNFIDMLNTFEKVDGSLKSQFMIPSMDDQLYRRIEIDFCALTRKDLSDDNEEIATEDDSRQKAKKEFNHPRDTVMSIIYTMIAKSQYKPGARTITLIGKKRRRLY